MFVSSTSSYHLFIGVRDTETERVSETSCIIIWANSGLYIAHLSQNLLLVWFCNANFLFLPTIFRVFHIWISICHLQKQPTSQIHLTPLSWFSTLFISINSTHFFFHLTPSILHTILLFSSLCMYSWQECWFNFILISSIFLGTGESTVIFRPCS